MKRKILKLSILFLLTGLLVFPKESTKTCKTNCVVKCAPATKIAKQPQQIPVADDEPSSIVSTPGYCLLIIK